VLRAQIRDLSSHLNEIELVIVGLIRQMKLMPLRRIKRSRRNEYVGATTSPG